MSADDIDLGQQTGLASQLSKSLAEATTRMNSFSDSSRTQAKFAIDIANSFKQTSDYLDSMSNSTEKINNCLDSFLQGVKSLSTNSGMSEFFKSFVKHIDETTDKFKKTAAATEELADVAEKAQTSSEKSQESLNKAAKEEKKYASAQKKQTKDYIENLTRANKSADHHNKTQEEFAKAAEEAQEAGKSWAASFKSAISFGLNLVKIIGSLISTATSWVKTVFTLPFMVIKNVVKAGNALRSDLVTVIEQAAQDTKEFFDSFSDIGQGIRRMTSMGKGMLLEFENVNSDAVKLFGQGASGIATMIKETSSSIKAMGNYSEVFGSTITKNKDALFNFTRVKKAMGLEDDQIAYYAQDAAVNLMGLNKRVTVMSLLTDDVSKQFGVDMKRLSKNFNVLRKDIALYGHLSDEELLKTTARLTQMKVSVEDASSVFKKFNTFEDAANSVAMLSQTFGMNLDAMDIIKAKNPEDIINMFRDSMIATGRTFDEFNRFEKEILADQTGMSQEGLKALMTLRDKGLTHQEAVDAMKDQTPEARQLKAIKELSSSINMLQKVMNFTSPFEAFLKGLGKNAAASKEARKAFMSLSNTYQMIHDFALKLDGDTVSSLLEPVILIVDVMKNILNSPGFKGGLTSLVKGFADLSMNLFGITETDKIYTVLEKNLNGMTKDQSEKLSADLTQIESGINSEKIKDLYNKHMKDKKNKGTKQEKFKEFLKDFRKKSLDDPLIKKEFDLMMENFHKKYKMTSFQTKVKTGKNTGKVIDEFQKTLKEVLSGNTENFEKLFNISGATAGAILKGASILLISGINLLNHVVAKMNPDGLLKDSTGQSLIESFFQWEPGTLRILGNEMWKSLSGLFASTGKLAFFGLWISEQFGSLLLNVGTFFWSALKSAGKDIWPDVFGSKDTFGEVLQKTKQKKEGYYTKSQQDSSNINVKTSQGQKSFASKLVDITNSDTSGAFSGVTSDLSEKVFKNKATKDDYSLMNMMQGFQQGTQSVEGPPAPITAKDSAIFGKDKTEERKEKEGLFSNKINDLYQNQAKMFDDQYKQVFDSSGIFSDLGSTSYSKGLRNIQESYGDGSEKYTLERKTDNFYKTFGRLINTFETMSDKQLLSEVFGEQIPLTTQLYQNSSPLSGKKPLWLDQIKVTPDINTLQRQAAGAAQADTKMQDGILNTVTSFASSFAAKPGGVVDTLFGGLSRLSTEAAATSANINNMYGDSSISSSENRLTNKKVDLICKKLEEYKSSAKDAKVVNVPFDISDEICDMLGVRLVERGLLDKMSRPDIMSASTTRLKPNASIAGNLQPGRQGINPGQEYMYYDTE
jgi:hypothetical protein